MHCYFEDYPEFKDLIIPSPTVLNDSMSEMSGKELQVRKTNNISNKRPYRPSDSIRHK